VLFLANPLKPLFPFSLAIDPAFSFALQLNQESGNQPYEEIAMAEIATRLPLSLDEVFAIAGGREVSCLVELAHRDIIEIEKAGGREGYLLTAAFHFQLDGEPYLVSKPYVFGYQDESPEVTVANRKMANGRLRRDYRRLHDARIEIQPRYFE
jgi:hypothetical protein